MFEKGGDKGGVDNTLGNTSILTTTRKEEQDPDW